MTKPAEYSLTDNACAKLLGQLDDRKFEGTSLELRANILDFYSDPNAQIDTRRENDDWNKVLAELERLKSATPTATRVAAPKQDSANAPQH